MDDYRSFREAAQQTYRDQKSARLELRGGETPLALRTRRSLSVRKEATDMRVCPPPGMDSDELDSNVEDWEEETIEFFINEEIIPLGDL